MSKLLLTKERAFLSLFETILIGSFGEGHKGVQTVVQPVVPFGVVQPVVPFGEGHERMQTVVPRLVPWLESKAL
jgi:hypothetical protein